MIRYTRNYQWLLSIAHWNTDLQLERRYRLAEQEKLAMESEISQLRASPIHERDSPYDMVRSSTVLSDNLTRIEALQSHVKELEAYIIEQV